jgi:hypothetical protein
MRQYHPGDWVDVGRQHAQLWITEGEAEAPPADNYKASSNTWLSIIGEDKSRLITTRLNISYSVGKQYELKRERNILWNTSLNIKPQYIPVGLELLDVWQMVVPLYSYTTLACDIGTESDRDITAALISDLRIPVYEPRFIVCRNDELCAQIIAEWQQDTGDSMLSFMRAIYRHNPYIMPVPTLWVN